MAIATLIQEILRFTPVPFRLVTTCGGDFLRQLLETPGISAVLREVVVPYSPESMAEYLGSSVEQASCERTARQLATQAFLAGSSRVNISHAEYSVTNSNTKGYDFQTVGFGLAAVASLASDRPKHGDHRVDVAYVSASEVRVFHVTFTKGKRDRATEDRLASELLAMVMAIASRIHASNTINFSIQPKPPISTQSRWQIPESLELLTQLDETEPLTSRAAIVPMELRRLWSGEIPYITCTIPAQGPWIWEVTSPPPLIFPGSWNPLHRGHLAMKRFAEAKYSASCAYECAIRNVDKPPLDYLEVMDRLERFEPGSRVVLSRLPTFAEKSQHFTGATFIVGADTYQRLIDPKYYGGSEQERDLAVERIVAQNSRFLVFGRSQPAPTAAGVRFVDPKKIHVPQTLRRHTQFVSELEFRDDISSTAIRRGESQPQQ